MKSDDSKEEETNESESTDDVAGEARRQTILGIYFASIAYVEVIRELANTEEEHEAHMERSSSLDE